MKGFLVRVIRYSGYDGLSESCFGMFVSKVYAIKDNMFLVYDPGDDDTSEGFRWVDFRECTSEILGYKPIVTLVREDE